MGTLLKKNLSAGRCAIFESSLPNNSPTFLIVCFRYLGDVLVTTPLALSLKEAYPDSTIEYLVFRGAENILANNPLVSRVIAVPKDRSNIGTLLSMYRKYDVAFAAYPSDRTLIAAALAGKRSVGLTYDHHPGLWWKKLLLSHRHSCDDRIHVVPTILSLLSPLGIPAIPRVSMRFSDDDQQTAAAVMQGEPYVILHPYSRNRCKYWPAERWGELAGLIRERTGFRAVVTRTPAPEDQAYLEQILAAAPAETEAFTEPLPLGVLAAVIKRGRAFVGIDTAVTHMAAALEVPTIALIGPSLSRYWGPWPNGCQDPSPFIANRGIQRVGNVTLVQKEWECVPCNQESCSISSRGRMECLEAVTPHETLEELFACIERSRCGTTE